MRREWIEIGIYGWNWDGYLLSPSMRREWIEIAKISETDQPPKVSLHAEGVD